MGKNTASEAIELRGKMGREIATLIIDGELTQAQAEKFVAGRAVEKLRKEIAKQQEA